MFLYFCGHEVVDFGFYCLMLPNVGFQILVSISLTQFRNYTAFLTDYFDGKNIRFKLIQANRSNLKHSRRF